MPLSPATINSTPSAADSARDNQIAGEGKRKSPPIRNRDPAIGDIVRRYCSKEGHALPTTQRDYDRIADNATKDMAHATLRHGDSEALKDNRIRGLKEPGARAVARTRLMQQALGSQFNSKVAAHFGA
jgi:hypothetical protein